MGHPADRAVTLHLSLPRSCLRAAPFFLSSFIKLALPSPAATALNGDSGGQAHCPEARLRRREFAVDIETENCC